MSAVISKMHVKNVMHSTRPLRKSSKLCVKTLFVTVTIISLNVLLNDSCFKIIVDTLKITEAFQTTKATFLPLGLDFFLFEHIELFTLLMSSRRR